jgi:hypothetical protein
MPSTWLIQTGFCVKLRGMLETGKILKFAEYFSLVTVGGNKVPNFKWKPTQIKKLDNSKLIRQIEYKGGHFYKDENGKDKEQPGTTNFGIVTGYDFLEVLDIDLKVLSTTKEKESIWMEMLSLFKDAIFDFEEKFVIYKTQSEGFHILYKTKRVQGNLKISKLKGHKEALIETRGIGGYVFAYPHKKYSKKSYFEIEFISDEDRESLMRVAKSFNYEEPKDEVKNSLKKKFQNDSQSKTPWDDFNEKNNVWDVVSDEFVVIKDTPKRIFIKRHNATSAHSGYIYKDDNLLYLFSTGTLYPHEKQISPSSAFAYKYHKGDFSASAKDLYEQGFGSRIKAKVDEIKPIIKDLKPVLNELDFPIDIFPKDIQFYLTECQNKLDSNIDYMGSSLIWLISLCIGNSFEIEVKRGWNENPAVWIAVVGKAGIGKTPSIHNVIFPLQKENSKEIKKYIEDRKNQEYFSSLSKSDKETHPEPRPAIKTQFIANDITLEALVDLHQESDNAVAVFKDELAGWLKDMNKYRAGSDLEFWLSTWSGKSVNLNRMSRAGSFVEKPFIPVLGGIQPSVFNSFSTEENKENGFMDRMLLSFPEATIDRYNDDELDYATIKWYEQVIVQFYQEMKEIIKRKDDGSIIANRVKWKTEAKTEWIRIFNKITDNQNNDDENEYLKSMYPKQKAYIPRFALIIHVFDAFFDADKSKGLDISKESILKAERLSDYFVNNARKVKLESTEISDIKAAFGKSETNFEKLEAIYKKDPDFNRSKVAELIGISRVTIHRYLEKLDNNKK